MAILQTCYCCSSLKQLAVVAGCCSLLLSSVYVLSFVLTHSVHLTDDSPLSVANNASSAAGTRPGHEQGHGGHEQVQQQQVLSLFHVQKPKSSASLSQASSSSSSSAGDPTTSRVPVVVGSVINEEGFVLQDIFPKDVVKLVCDLAVIISCIILFLALAKEIRSLLIPWIVANLVQSGLYLFEDFFLLKQEWTQFEPVTAFIFTIHFLILLTHFYFILGVISLYQEDFRFQHGSGSSINNNHYNSNNISNMDEMRRISSTSQQRKVSTASTTVLLNNNPMSPPSQGPRLGEEALPMLMVTSETGTEGAIMEEKSPSGTRRTYLHTRLNQQLEVIHEVTSSSSAYGIPSEPPSSCQESPSRQDISSEPTKPAVNDASSGDIKPPGKQSDPEAKPSESSIRKPTARFWPRARVVLKALAVSTHEANGPVAAKTSPKSPPVDFDEDVW